MFRSSLAAAFIATACIGAQAEPVTISTPYVVLENKAVNSLGLETGQYLFFGTLSVTANDVPGTTGLATTTNQFNGSPVSHVIYHLPSPLLKDFYAFEVPLNPALLGPWALTFTNGPDSAQAQVQLPPGAQIAPFVNSITLSGTSANPTFSWTSKPGTTVNNYVVNIYDKSLINFDPANGPINTGLVASIERLPNVTSNVTSYTVVPGDFTVAGNSFTLNKNYSIEIGLIQTRDGSSNLGNGNLQSTSHVYADFTPNNGGGPPVNLPVVLANGSYQFNMAVQPGQTYYIDPEVATGYDYAIGLGDPNFQSVVLPTGIGDGLYDIYGFDTLNDPFLLAHDLLGGDVFDFGLGGVNRFRVAGIEPSAGLDPSNTTAFVTGLTFAANGNFTGTQTPITLNVQSVPEPASLALFGLALAGLVVLRRSKS